MPVTGQPCNHGIWGSLLKLLKRLLCGWFFRPHFIAVRRNLIFAQVSQVNDCLADKFVGMTDFLVGFSGQAEFNGLQVPFCQAQYLGYVIIDLVVNVLEMLFLRLQLIEQQFSSVPQLPVRLDIHEQNNNGKHSNKTQYQITR
jgi:hypothetical protein